MSYNVNLLIKVIKYFTYTFIFSLILLIIPYSLIRCAYIICCVELYSIYRSNIIHNTNHLLILYWIYCTSAYLLYIYIKIHPILCIIIVIYCIYSDGFSYIFGNWLGSGANKYLPPQMIYFIQYRPVPHLSPNKTIAGYIGTVIGGIFAALSIILLQYIVLLFRLTITIQYNLYIWSIIITILGQLGDLWQSYIKRRLHIKDMGNILGSRGGVCDRIDSIAIIAIIMMIFNQLQWITVTTIK